MNAGKKPSDKDLIHCLRIGMNYEEIAVKYNRSIIGIQNRASELLYQQALEAHRTKKIIPDITEDELLNTIPIDDLTIGQVQVKKGIIRMKSNGQEVAL